MENKNQNTFNKNLFETNQSENGETAIRDPYFEKYTYDLYMDMSENPSELFNFFLENNDIFKKISSEDELYLFKQLRNRREYCTYAFWGSLAASLGYFKLAHHRIFPQITQPKSRGLFFNLCVFGARYALPPLVGSLAMDSYLDVEQDFLNMAGKYSFKYDDFDGAMKIFERAKLLGFLDELIEKRDDFDFKKLEQVPVYNSKAGSYK